MSPSCSPQEGEAIKGAPFRHEMFLICGAFLLSMLRNQQVGSSILTAGLK